MARQEQLDSNNEGLSGIQNIKNARVIESSIVSNLI